MSVFTFIDDSPRVSSPWLQPTEPGKNAPKGRSSNGSATVQSGLLSDYGVTKLEAEPQEGPTEYKLHLLLRPRRTYTATSTTLRVSGSIQSRPVPSQPKLLKHSPQLQARQDTRQERLYHLTTQLLWRLKQTCSYHAAANTTDLVLPLLPDDASGIPTQVKPGKLPPGLEESRGALYEIGVADDGTLIGLTKDEMEESLAILRIMAASLGCTVEILRMVIVGDCEWLENNGDHTQQLRKGKLWVSEALVTPDLGSRENGQEPGSHKSQRSPAPDEGLPVPVNSPLTTDQLRVTLTGPTTSGKSTLLGTLSTGTLDNGRGTSRQSLLKHRHEVASGITSSVSQELLGYKDESIINYAFADIESWIGIHDHTKDGRLVFVSDSAGHPRYRRTILRGMIGWAPHWTLLCVPADDSGKTSGVGATASAQEILGDAGAEVDLVQAHLDLCLSLEVPLAIIITKLDLATRPSLQGALGKVLSAIKGRGRVPRILQPDQRAEVDLNHISSRDAEAVKQVTGGMVESSDLLSTVPIILASAVKGSGIGLIHALLKNLPLPPTPTSHDFIGPALNPEQPACLFHIEDKFSLPASYASLALNHRQSADSGTVVAGYLRFGSLSVGDKILVGPFPSEDDEARGITPEDRPSPGSYGLSISHPSSAELARIALKNAVSASTIKGEWHNAHIVSIRNLRLPVQTLEAGQAGSIGIVIDFPKEVSSDSLFESAGPPTLKLRKGMVLAIPSKHMVDSRLSLQAASGLTAAFPDTRLDSLSVGSLVNIYVASVRAAARVLHVSRASPAYDASRTATEDIDDVFNLNDQMEADDMKKEAATPSGVEVQLELLTTREWIELGSRILILEGGSKDRSGLEGYVGKVVEIVD